MTLKKKIFFPVLGAIVLLGSLGYFIMQRELSKLDAYLSKQVVSEKQGEIDAMIRLTAEQAKQKAALFTQLPEVLQAFEIAHSGNINDEKDPKGQEAREFLRRVLKASMDGYTRVMNGDKLQLHFHLPNGHSLLRMWREKQSIRDENWEDISDDISDFRHTVLDVNRSGQSRYRDRTGTRRICGTRPCPDQKLPRGNNWDQSKCLRISIRCWRVSFSVRLNQKNRVSFCS